MHASLHPHARICTGHQHTHASASQTHTSAPPARLRADRLMSLLLETVTSIGGPPCHQRTADVMHPRRRASHEFHLRGMARQAHMSATRRSNKTQGTRHASLQLPVHAAPVHVPDATIIAGPLHVTYAVPETSPSRRHSTPSTSTRVRCLPSCRVWSVQHRGSRRCRWKPRSQISCFSPPCAPFAPLRVTCWCAAFPHWMNCT